MTALSPSINSGYLRSPVFDISFIAVIPIVAFFAGALSHVDDNIFDLLLYLNLWILGYHHVISTYTRLAFDRDALEDHRFLIYYLPIFVILAVGIIAWTIGLIAIATIYLHWQWYHYTRQSEGISKAYSIKSGTDASRQTTFDRVVFYFVPISCFLDMSSNGQQMFLGMRVWVIPISQEFTFWLMAVTSLVFIVWLVKKAKLLIEKKISISYFSYLMSHYTIYYIAYAYVDNINYGWIIINIWHNAQYVAFVWLFNTNKYGKLENSKNPFLFLARPNNALLYFAACFICSTLIYISISELIDGFPIYMAIIVYQAINFHHYIVDSRIWKLRKKPLQQTLKIEA
jgi:hypothetical protein